MIITTTISFESYLPGSGIVWNGQSATIHARSCELCVLQVQDQLRMTWTWKIQWEKSTQCFWVVWCHVPCVNWLISKYYNLLSSSIISITKFTHTRLCTSHRSPSPPPNRFTGLSIFATGPVWRCVGTPKRQEPLELHRWTGNWLFSL